MVTDPGYFNLPYSGDWVLEASEQETEIIMRLGEAMKNLYLLSKTIGLDISAIQLIAKVKLPQGRGEIVIIDPYSLVSYFIGNEVVIDEYLDLSYQNCVTIMGIEEWLDTIIARLTNLIDKESRKYIKNEQMRNYIEILVEFFELHRRKY